MNFLHKILTVSFFLSCLADIAMASPVMNVTEKGDSFLIEIPSDLMGRVFLVTNRLQKVPKELNDAGVNKGINYQNQSVRFEWDRKHGKLYIRQQRTTPEVAETDNMAPSVRDNYIDPVIASLKIESVASDSSSVTIMANSLFNGEENYLNDVFNNINIGSSADTRLSRLLDIRSFGQSLTAWSELSTVVYEGTDYVNITVVTTCTLTLLPETPMTGREETQRIGYFTSPVISYSDTQQTFREKKYINRWRLEPVDKESYLNGELSEPVKPIVFYIDKAVPAHLRPYIRQGILDWNEAFEAAGFKNAVQVYDFPDSLEAEGDDMSYSVLTYAASDKANAMGPTVIDPRSGEILEADIIWWHNVQSRLREWLRVQTGQANPAVRSLEIPDGLMGAATRFVACHETGHSLGLRHNMRASNAWPTDSLRSARFVKEKGGTSASIMDYARFNYLATDNDETAVLSPHIGPYDLLAIEWGYRWYPSEDEAQEQLYSLLDNHREKEYLYSEAQDMRTVIDPRSQSEDLGDDVLLSARYGIENLKKIVPNIVDWTRDGKPGQTYDEAAELYAEIIYQWSLYTYHALAYIGGYYIENTGIDDGLKTFTPVEAGKQEDALKFIIDEVLTYPDWLFGIPLTEYTYFHRKTPDNIIEEHPDIELRNQQNYILWDMLDNERIMRMLQNEQENPETAFTATQMMQTLHEAVFASTIARRNPTIQERYIQKSLVDALITAASESQGVKINKSISDRSLVEIYAERGFCREDGLSSSSLTSDKRQISFGSSQANRCGDALSIKRGELNEIKALCKKRLKGADKETRMHYEDIVMRIDTALGIR